jgi:SAM-dependent methyltransferase
MKQGVAEYYWSRLGDAREVLDLGCGNGELGAHRPPDRVVHALEIDPAKVATLSGYTSARVWDLDDRAPLPFPDNSFDAVVAKDILEHLQRPWETLREVRRVLRLSGVVVASLICYRSRRLWADYTHVRGFTEQSATQLFEDAGFRVVALDRMGPVPLSSRLNGVAAIPYLLKFPPFDWMWTSSYEIVATVNH